MKFPEFPEFHHEAMATTFTLVIADQSVDYARQAATACFRELDRLESELSRYVESSDIARANRLNLGETIVIGEDALHCLWLAADASLATDRAFDCAYASERAPAQAADAPLFTLDPAAHTLTSHTAQLHLDLGAIGKGYALDRLAAVLADWAITRACLHGGGSSVLALDPPAGQRGWPISLGEDQHQRVLSLTQAVAAATEIPARAAGIAEETGGLVPGKSADLILVRLRGETPTVLQTYVQGERVHAAGREAEHPVAVPALELAV
jgi:thiamine biosynthesis lipoprotein